MVVKRERGTQAWDKSNAIGRYALEISSMFVSSAVKYRLESFRSALPLLIIWLNLVYGESWIDGEIRLSLVVHR